MTTIVLTRPAADSQRLAGLLDAHGFATLSLPLLALEPLAPEPVPPPVCDTPAIWIFISANAVRFGLPQGVKKADWAFLLLHRWGLL